MLERPEAIRDRYLHETARNSLLLWRERLAAPLDAPGASYFGGLPKLPADVSWPTADIEGEDLALMFVGQIDLADIPDGPCRSLLPESGALFFFASDELTDDDTPCDAEGDKKWGFRKSAVIFTPNSVADTPVRTPPTNRQRFNQCMRFPEWTDDDDVRQSGGFRFNLRIFNWISYRDKVPEDDRHWRWGWRPFREEETKALFEFGLLKSPEPEDDELFRARNEYRRICTDIPSGMVEYSQKNFDELATNHGLLPPDPTRFRVDLKHYPTSWIGSWRFIQDCAQSLMHPLTFKKEGPERDAFNAECETWVRTAQSHAADAPPHESVREEFSAWMTDLSTTKKIYDLGNWRAWKEASFFHVHRLSEAGQVHLVDPDQVQSVASGAEYTSPLSPDWAFPHAMFGNGWSDHVSAEPGHLPHMISLLCVLAGDGPGFFAPGCEGATQFWITPDDLSRRDFSNVEAYE